MTVVGVYIQAAKAHHMVVLCIASQKKNKFNSVDDSPRTGLTIENYYPMTATTIASGASQYESMGFTTNP